MRRDDTFRILAISAAVYVAAVFGVIGTQHEQGEAEPAAAPQQQQADSVYRWYLPLTEKQELEVVEYLRRVDHERKTGE